MTWPHFQKVIAMHSLAVGLGLILLASPALSAEMLIRIELTFDPAAKQKLLEMGEMVTLSAFFFGEPAPGTTLPIDEMNQVWLGAEDITVWPGDQLVVMGGGLSGAPVEGVIQPMINVNVFSARYVDELNILNCDIAEGPVAELSKAVQRIHCALP